VPGSVGEGLRFIFDVWGTGEGLRFIFDVWGTGAPDRSLNCPGIGRSGMSGRDGPPSKSGGGIEVGPAGTIVDN